jgi:HemY protein
MWIAAAFIGLAVAGYAVWKQQAAAKLRRLLPPIPNVSGRPAGLAVALADAEHQATSAGSSDAGLAELGRIYQANNFLPQAEACWRQLMQREPDDGHWTYYLADLSRSGGDDDAMGGWLRKTVEISPDYSTAWLKLAEWEFKTGQVDQSGRDYLQRLSLTPGDPYAQLGLARVALAHDQRDAAAHQIESIVQQVPTFYPAHNLLAEILAQRGDAAGAKVQRALGRAALRFREADDPWLEELRSRCFDVDRICLWASIDLTTNHGDHGIALLERAIQIAPDDPVPFVDLGQIYLQIRDPATARQKFESAIDQPKAPADAFAGLSDALRALKRPDLAENAARRGLERSPNDANLETALGNAQREQGQVDDAIATFRLATQHAPTVAETFYNLGSAQLLRGPSAEAEENLRHALALKETYAPALAALGRICLAAGKTEEAGRYISLLYQTAPQAPDASRLMGVWCLQAATASAKAGQLADAERELRQGLTAAPDLPELNARLGLLLGQQGRYADSLPPLEAYRKLQPKEALASLFLGQAYANLGRTADARQCLNDGETLARDSGQQQVQSLCSRLLQTLPP